MVAVAGGSLMKLTESNYPSWKTMMEDYLYCHDLYDPVEGDSAKPSEMSDKNWDKLNRKTVAIIRQSIDISLFDQVAMETSAHELWKKCETFHERELTKNKITTLKKLVNLKFEEEGWIYKHVRAFSGLVDELSSMNVVMNEELRGLLLMSSLPKNYEDFVISCCDKAPKGELTMQFVKSELLWRDLDL